MLSTKAMRLSWALILLMWVSSVMAYAQTAPSDPWADIKRAARLPVSQQLDPAIQGAIQDWFMAKVRFYQGALNDTALGQATPKIVDLGDWTNQFREALAPPRGNGTTTITFGKVGAPSTMEDTLEIIFPQDRADQYIDGFPDTCWHEFNHVLVMLSERRGRPIAVPFSPWRVYRKADTDKDADHIYIEGLGEFMTEWLDLLLHERSVLTNGPGMAFEKLCREAYEQIKNYQAKNEHISYAVERFCWAKPHDAYRRAWQSIGKQVAPLPLIYRQDYQQICGVWIGFVEDVVRFYMTGGLKATDGTPIHVPEWVMWPEPMKSSIIIGHLNEKKDISGNSLRYGFDVRITENYRYKERSYSLNHGKAIITLENPDKWTKLEISVDGKPIKRSATSGVIDLTGFRYDSKIRITFVCDPLSSSVGKKTYKISIEYQPERSVVINGVPRPSFYYPAKAIYYVEVTGTGKPAKPKAKNSQPISSKPQRSTAQHKGYWRLKDVIKNKQFDPLFANQNITADADVEDTGITFEATQQQSNPTRTVKWGSKHTWTPLGQTLTAETKLPVTITLHSTNPGPSCSLFAATQPKDPSTGGMTLGLFYVPHTGGFQSGGGGVVLANNDKSGTRTIDIPIPEGNPQRELVIGFRSSDAPMTVEIRFVYEWVGVTETPPATPTKADAVLNAQEPAPEPEPPAMDNIPPKPGDIVRIPETEQKPPPPPETKTKKTKAPLAENWYVHPTGDYKFKLLNGWNVTRKKFFSDDDDQYDTLWPPDKHVAIVCDRSFTDNGTQSADGVLKAYEAGVLKANPGAESTRIKLGSAEAQQIAVYDKNLAVMTWHLAIFYKGRSYYIAVSKPREAMEKDLPDGPKWMLNSIIFSR